MPQIVGIILIMLIVVGSVIWVEKGAIARNENSRLIEAIEIKNKSIKTIQEVSEEETKKLREEKRQSDNRNAELERKIALIPKPEPISSYCRPGCKPKWIE